MRFFIYRALLALYGYTTFVASVLTFEAKVYDTYDLVDVHGTTKRADVHYSTHGIASANATVYNASVVDAMGGNNPYFREDYSTIMYTAHSHEIALYDLDRRRVGSVSRVLVDCYEANDCEYTITPRDENILSAYGSMINQLGGNGVAQSFDLGIIRARDEEYTVGRFTISSDGGIAFWIRLKDNNHAEVYQQQDSLVMMLSILELAAHERAHYEVPYAGHCDSFQATYNVIVNNAIKRVRDYEKLTYHIVGTGGYVVYDNTLAIIIFVSMILIFTAVAWYACTPHVNADTREARFAPGEKLPVDQTSDPSKQYTPYGQISP